MDAHAMVSRLRAATGGEREQVLGELYAEKVEFRHVPPNEHDGFISRAKLVAGATWERSVFQQEIRDYTSTHEYEVTSAGIVETYHMGGILPGGEPLDSLMTITYTVSEGAITAMTADFDEAGTAPLRAVIARAGGFPKPNASG
jgi:hypothetical protein